jgi:hypothetical protein
MKMRWAVRAALWGLGRTEMHREFLGRKTEEKRPLENLLTRLKDDIKLDLKVGRTGFSGIVYLRTGSRGGLL